MPDLKRSEEEQLIKVQKEESFLLLSSPLQKVTAIIAIGKTGSSKSRCNPEGILPHNKLVLRLLIRCKGII